MFPLFSTKGNELVSLKGDRSFLFQVTPPDLEQIDKIDPVFKGLEEALTDEENEWIKLYHLNGEFWINSKENPILPACGVYPENNALGLFFDEIHSGVDFHEDYFINNGVYHRVISLSEFPSAITPWSFSGLDFCICLKTLAKEQAKHKLNLKRKLHYSSLFKGMKDIEGESAYSESEEVLEKVVSGEEKLVMAEVFFIQKAETKEELNVKLAELANRVRGIDGRILVETFGLEYFFSSIIPGVRPSFKRAQLAPSSFIAEMVPLHRDFVMQDGLKLYSRRGQKVLLDLFHPGASNFNVLITGTSGQGKSMLANKVVKELLDEGVSGMILDLGNSFRKNVLFHGGASFSEKINPLKFPDAVFLKEFVKAIMGESLSRKQEGKLLEAIKSMDLKNTDINGFIEGVEQALPGSSYCFSEYIDFLSTDNQDLPSLCYCDLGDYPESFKPALILYLLECFKSLKGRKTFVFDECWGLMKNNAEYIAECFRTFRKHDASAIAISQNLDDFSETQLGRVIIQNTYFKFLFRQNLEDCSFITPFQKSLHKSVNSEKGSFSEFLLLSEEHQKVCRYYCDPLEYELFNSSMQDKYYFELFMEEAGRYLEFNQAMINYTKIKNPRWHYEK